MREGQNSVDLMSVLGSRSEDHGPRGMSGLETL